MPRKHAKVDRFGKWAIVVFPRTEVALFMPCKSGQTSIRAAIETEPYDWVLPDEILTKYPAYMRVAAFRDPWDRFCSAWFDKGQKRAPTVRAFADWILTHRPPRYTNPHFRPQVESWTTTDGERMSIDLVLRTERLAEDWARFRMLGSGDRPIAYDPIGHKNRKSDQYSKARILQQLTGEQVKALSRFYAGDFEFQESL